MFKNFTIKNILLALAVAASGFVLLNLTFMMFGLVGVIFGWATRGSITENPLYGPIVFGVCILIVIILSIIVFRFKFPTLVKAMFMTVPSAVSYVILGIVFFRWPIAAYISGALFTIIALYIFYRKKLPWLYFYTVILVGLTLAIFTALGGQI